jgi:hypothetical protein
MKRSRGRFGNSSRLSLMLAICATYCPVPGASAQDPRSRLGEWSKLIPLGNLAVHTHVLPTGKVLFWDALYPTADERGNLAGRRGVRLRRLERPDL